MQFSKHLLAQIHIKLDEDGLNSLSAKEVIVLLAEQNQESTEFLAGQIQGPVESLTKQVQDRTEQILGMQQTRAEILQEAARSRQTHDEMMPKIAQSRQAQEKWQQIQESKIDKLFFWIKWIVVALVATGGAVTASVLANLIWEAIIKG